MKKYLILFMAVVSTSFFVGCDSDDDFTPPNYVTFAAEELDFTVNQNSSGTYDVTVYTNTITGAARTFAINVDESSTINAEDVNVPATVTVPANSNEGVFSIEVTDNTIDDAGETLILNIEDEEGLYVGEPLTVNVLKLCEFTALAPSYTGSVSAFGDTAPDFQVTLNNQGEMVFTAETLWGTEFIAWATGDASYSGSFVYSGTIELGADNTLTITSEDAYMLGGDGNYNPCTGTFSYTIETSLFGAPNVFVDVVLTPNVQ